MTKRKKNLWRDCTECGEQFSASDRGGRAKTCSDECSEVRERKRTAAYNAAYYQNNRDRLDTEHKAWADENPELTRSYGRKGNEKYRAASKITLPPGEIERLKAERKKRAILRKRERQAAWAKANPEYITRYHKERYARLKAARESGNAVPPNV